MTDESTIPVVFLNPRSTSHHHTHHTTVNEHRAPTDESVRLLKEMEEAVLKKITAIETLQTTVGEIRITTMKEPIGGVVYIINMLFNNKEISLRVRLDPILLFTRNKDDLILHVRDEIQKTIALALANELMIKAFESGFKMETPT